MSKNKKQKPNILYLSSFDSYDLPDNYENEDIVVIEYEDGDPDWEPIEFEYKNKILALDFDHTLVRPKNGKTFSKKNYWLWKNTKSI